VGFQNNSVRDQGAMAPGRPRQAKRVADPFGRSRARGAATPMAGGRDPRASGRTNHVVTPTDPVSFGIALEIIQRPSTVTRRSMPRSKPHTGSRLAIVRLARSCTHDPLPTLGDADMREDLAPDLRLSSVVFCSGPAAVEWSASPRPGSGRVGHLWAGLPRRDRLGRLMHPSHCLSIETFDVCRGVLSGRGLCTKSTCNK
jgi:hypothetical protein